MTETKKYAKKLNIIDNVIVADSLRNQVIHNNTLGYAFEVCLDYYRGQFLTVIDEFQITIDGEVVPTETIKFCINGKEFNPIEFEHCYSEFWQAIEPATINVFKPGGLKAGEHNVELHLIFRSPYMPIGSNHEYMAIDNCGKRTLSLVEEE